MGGLVGVARARFAAPKVLRPQQYTMAAQGALLGVPLRVGRVLLILPGLSDSSKASAAVHVHLSLHINGFSFVVDVDSPSVTTDKQEVLCVFSPFYYVRCVHVAGKHESTAPRIFKIAALHQSDQTFYFGCEVQGSGPGPTSVAERERSEWVTAFAHAVQIVA